MYRITLVTLLIVVAASSTVLAAEPTSKALSLRWFHGPTPEAVYNRTLWMGKIDGIISTLKNAWIAPRARAARKCRSLSKEVRRYGAGEQFERRLCRQLNFVNLHLRQPDSCKRGAIRQLRQIKRFIQQSLR